ncbi:Phospholipase A2, partial [Operophtera brumata]
WPSRLTYDKIYNSTSYAQIQHLPRPYTPVIHSQYRDSHSYSEETKGNEVDDEIDYIEDERKGQLLVGFARDPFRYSVPEEEYRKGVRSINPQTYTNRGDRGKRGVLHLYNMIFCATGCEPLAYKGYGCYCGFLGEGRPTDGIDRFCYENIYCPFFTVYFQPYYWKCYHNEPLCALENYHSKNQVVNGCAARLCDCDRQFAMCVRRYSCPRGRALCRSSPVRLLQNILMFR